jgi:hypothetical protein
VAVTRPAAPWTGPDQPVTEQPDPALPQLDRLLAGPCRPDWFPPPSVAPASPHGWALLRDHITFDMASPRNSLIPSATPQLLQEHDLDHWENPHEDRRSSGSL